MRDAAHNADDNILDLRILDHRPIISLGAAQPVLPRGAPDGQPRGAGSRDAPAVPARRTGLSNGQVCTEIGWRNDLGRSTGGLWTVVRGTWLARRVPSFSAPAMSPPTHSPDACARAVFEISISGPGRRSGERPRPRTEPEDDAAERQVGRLGQGREDAGRRLRCSANILDLRIRDQRSPNGVLARASGLCVGGDVADAPKLWIHRSRHMLRATVHRPPVSLLRSDASWSVPIRFGPNKDPSQPDPVASKSCASRIVVAGTGSRLSWAYSRGAPADR